jgi:hypothetical protein
MRPSLGNDEAAVVVGLSARQYNVGGLRNTCDLSVKIVPVVAEGPFLPLDQVLISVLVKWSTAKNRSVDNC